MSYEARSIMTAYAYVMLRVIRTVSTCFVFYHVLNEVVSHIKNLLFHLKYAFWVR